MRARHVWRPAASAALAAGAALLFAASRSRPALTDPKPFDPPGDLPPGRAVPVPGHGELFVRDSGTTTDGPVFLLLHGWFVTADLNWYTSYRSLAALGRVIALDHRGHGRGARPAQPFRLVDAADDAAALLRHLEVGPVIVIGYSMGGPIAQLLWRRHPGHVRGLVLCATAATFSGSLFERLRWRGMGILQVGLRLLPRNWYEAGISLQLDGRMPVPISRVVGPDSPREVRDLLGWALGEVARGSAEDVAEAGRELGRYDARPWLEAVAVPSAVVVTSHDRLVPRDRQLELAAVIPTARVYDVRLDHDAPARRDVFLPALRAAASHVAADSESLGDDADAGPPKP